MPDAGADRRRPLMRFAAIVPQQRLTLAKSRLAPVLGLQERETLSLGLLRGVCGVLRQVPAVEMIAIMTPDPAVQGHAARWGIPSWPDPAPGLNAALAEAIARRHHAGGRRGVLVIAADLPHLSAPDVAALVGAAGARTLVLAASKDGTGTNALVVPWGARFRPSYGAGSCAAHHREAARAGLRVIELYRPGLAFDVDLPEDLLSGGCGRRGHAAGGPGWPGGGYSQG